MAETIFAKIIAKEIPAKIVYEDNDVLAFHDIGPQAPTHVLVIPKKPFEGLLDVSEDDTLLLGRLVQACVHVARTLGLAEDGFRVVVNTGENGGQAVQHLHFHVLGGRPMTWPPG
ncbi:MAG: histidine triad nucleotide-binding protein [Capsulimonadaceae bacterium]